MEESVRQFRIVVVGDSNTGKSSIIHRLIQKDFTNEIFATVGVRDLQYETPSGVFILTDTAGQEQYISACSSIYNKADCFILLASWDSIASFGALGNFWIHRLKDFADLSKVPSIVAVNKCDLEDEEKEISRKDFDRFSLKDFDVFGPEEKWSVSAKDDENITQLFESAFHAAQNSWNQRGCSQPVQLPRETSVPATEESRRNNAPKTKSQCCK
jgi:small GTP-binding protein